MSDRSYVIFENVKFGWISPALAPHLRKVPLSQPPTLHSIEEVEQFIEDLREAADRVFGVDRV